MASKHPTPESDLTAELRKRVVGEVRFDPYSRVLYSTDASSYQIQPIGVVIPRTMDDVYATVETAIKHGVPILARGGGSSLAGQAVGEALIIDFSKHLNRIVSIDPEAGVVRAEAGVVCDALNAALKPHGLMFGTEPASSNRATVGGMISNNSTGAHSVMFGMTADHIRTADVILSDGSRTRLEPLDESALQVKQKQTGLEGKIYRDLPALVRSHAGAIRERFPKTWRRASGYSLNYMLDYAATAPDGWYRHPEPYPPPSAFNLARLLCASEGTLAVLTHAEIGLVPRPKRTALQVLHFDSVVAAAAATPTILECRPAAVELIDRLIIGLTRSVPAYARQLTFVQGHPAAILVVEHYGVTDAELESKMDRLESHLARAGVSVAIVRAVTAEAQANVWGVRKVGLGLLMSMTGDAKPLPFMEDVAVPVDRLADYVRAAEDIFAEFGVQAGYYAHASAGCLHIRPSISLKTGEGIATMRAVAQAVLETVIRMGGAMSGEHGDGLSRSEWNARLFGPELYGAFRETKRLFDPRGLLNPGKIVDAPPMDQNLRYGAGYATRPISTRLSFERQGGLARAVEQCNGAGVCRQADGTMCPSYQATREEEHSTRGRANALRAALSGRLPEGAFTDERMHAVLDLCLECKACKAECPSGVDMAKIKYEFLAHYQARHGVPLRSRFFAGVHSFSRLAVWVAPIANLVLSTRVGRWLMEKALGLSRQRQLPTFAFPPFRWRVRGKLDGVPGGREVVFFDDTFTQFNHPEIGLAAVKVLRAAGYSVRLVNKPCCGRPMLSKGLLADARRMARAVVDSLAPYAERGVPIVGVEPSCLLTLRDEYLDLLPGDPRAQAVADQAVMIDEFLSRAAEAGELSIRWKQQPARVLFHGHCYQKALTGTAPTQAMLQLPGWEVSEIDSGCCGMAGSFGYEAEHFRISQAIGEDRLFPAVRAAGDRAVVAAGMSCRHQIHQGTGRRVPHPIELLANAIDE